MKSIRIHTLVLMTFCFLISGCAGIDACKAPTVQEVKLELVHDDQRATSFTVFAPEASGEYPLIVFSHGAYSAPERYQLLLRALAATGFVVTAPLHIDSELLTNGKAPPPHHTTWATRKADIALPLSRVSRVQAALKGARVASPADGYLAVGHSYGAFVAQTLAGAAAVGEQHAVDSRLDGVIAFSPPGPLPGFIREDAWDAMAKPQLVLTGTADILPGFIDDWRAHAMAHEQANAGDQWLWVGQNVDHYFGRMIGRLTGDVPPQQKAFTDALRVAEIFAVTYADTTRRDCVAPLTETKDTISSLSRR